MMDKICWLDVIILLPLLFGLIRGLIRGMVTELNAVLALVLGVLGAKVWGPDFGNWLHHFSSWNTDLCMIIAYIALFLAIAIVLHLVGEVLQKTLKKIKLQWVNRLMGAICGTLKWAIIVLVLVFIVGQADKNFHFIPDNLKAKSITYQPALNCVNKIWADVKQG